MPRWACVRLGRAAAAARGSVRPRGRGPARPAPGPCRSAAGSCRRRPCAARRTGRARRRLASGEAGQALAHQPAQLPELLVSCLAIGALRHRALGRSRADVAERAEFLQRLDRQRRRGGVGADRPLAFRLELDFEQARTAARSPCRWSRGPAARRDWWPGRRARAAAPGCTATGDRATPADRSTGGGPAGQRFGVGGHGNRRCRGGEMRREAGADVRAGQRRQAERRGRSG